MGLELVGLAGMSVLEGRCVRIGSHGDWFRSTVPVSGCLRVSPCEDVLALWRVSWCRTGVWADGDVIV